MTESTTTPEDDGARPAGRHTVLAILLRSAGTALALLLAYALVPVGRSDLVPMLLFVLGTLLFVLSLGRQLRAIIASPTPALQAVETVALLLPLALLTSAGAYLIISSISPESFNEPMGKIDSFYLATMVLTTVGFGDIVPVTPGARIALTIQMLSNLLIVGFVARAISSAIARGQEARKKSSSKDN